MQTPTPKACTNDGSQGNSRLSKESLDYVNRQLNHQGILDNLIGFKIP